MVIESLALSAETFYDSKIVDSSMALAGSASVANVCTTPLMLFLIKATYMDATHVLKISTHLRLFPSWAAV